ncbi:MAG: hypothetical protein PHD81_03305 [Candidatus Nanoarchaeia archaeon]|nr:hypothetical protein [Candidatus Nanoarchaeia archaeon]MDD5588112.1 hypothetical protein [Candidatus Nanoarchaeia archaeon]
MKISIKKGLGFGLTSGIITTLGLIIGLYSSTNSKLVVIGGILTIAIADAFSDALGMHMSEEYSRKQKSNSIWEATISTFISKFAFALTFIVPVLALSLGLAVIVSIIWGLSLIIIFSYIMAKEEKINPFRVIREHLLIAIIVVIATYYVGKLIDFYFGV